MEANGSATAAWDWLDAEFALTCGMEGPTATVGLDPALRGVGYAGALAASLDTVGSEV
jgi:hypothetical protein